MGYVSGATRVFPATSVMSSVSSLPLTVRFAFNSSSAGLRRVWLGFAGTSMSSSSPSTLVLRCGQHVVQMGSSASTDMTTSHSTMNNNNNNNKNGSATSTHSNHSHSPRTSTPKINDVTEEGPPEDTTDIIIYVAIGLSGLLLLSFVYVFLKKIRKKDAQPGVRPRAGDLECGTKPTNNTINDPAASADVAQPAASSNNNNISMKDINSTKNAVTNGSPVVPEDVCVRPVASDHVYLGGIEMSVSAMRNHDYRRHRSLLSLQQSQSSFSNLEEIRESEEENQFPTHHKHSTIDLDEAFKIISKRLPPAIADAEDTVSADDVDDDRQSDDSDDKGEDSHDKHQRPVLFHLGSNESSDPDLEYISL